MPCSIPAVWFPQTIHLIFNFIVIQEKKKKDISEDIYINSKYIWHAIYSNILALISHKMQHVNHYT